MKLILVIAIALIALKWLGQIILNQLNRKNILAHADEIPAAFSEVMDKPTYSKSVAYSLAKSGLSKIELTWDALILALALSCSFFPSLLEQFSKHLGSGVWSMAAFLLAGGMLLSIPSLPLDWYSQFVLEEKFGFNKTTPCVWFMDRVKGLTLAVLLGLPLLALILWLAKAAGSHWWVWAWAFVTGFQLLMMVLAPMVILPLFNKFTPLPEGSLRERLLELGRKTGFVSSSILVMDGSKRSSHSNAFFTGFGRFRRIVLFDTLIEQLSEPELEAVLAHEVGHYKKRHILKMLVWSTLGSLVAFYGVAWLAGQEEFYRAFGFAPGNFAPALLLFALLSGVVTFWLTPLGNRMSRKHEYQADAYACMTVRGPSALIGALRKLNEKNLSNLTPHPIYSSFYYSHPTLLEREDALKNLPAAL